MRLRVLHETRYTYDQPARGLIQVLRLTPASHEGQHVRRWRIEPSVDGGLKVKEDILGNVIHVFSADGAIDELVVRVSGEVETFDTHGVVSGTLERVPEAFYLRDTDLTTPDDALRAFASDLGAADPLTRLHDLLNAINKTIVFDTAPTHSATTAAEAFAMRRGVCQDLTHVFIATARHLGIPARYVSGYFFRSDGVVEQEAGHAWAEAKVPGLGWVGFDPANGIGTGPAHLRLAIGLDYLGAAPIRGSRYGGGNETLDVRLRVDNGQEPTQTQTQTQG
jgi:transglutaminase-like putative cysteine protease